MCGNKISSDDCKSIYNIINEIYKKNSSNSDYFNFGLNKFGPLLYGFMLWLKDKAINNDIKKLFFLSRDGYLMKKAFDIINDSLIETEYVYFSRKSIRQPLLHMEGSYVDSLKYLSKEKFISIGQILEYYGFDCNNQNYIIEKYNLDPKDQIRYNDLYTNKKIKEIYIQLKQEIDEISMLQDRYLMKYLEQIKFDKHVGIVDIGWHSSIQYYLEKYIEGNNLNIFITGFYLGNNCRYNISGKTFGYLYDDNNNNLRKDVLCFFGGYEKLFQSMEGTTFGYDEDNGCIIPILGKYEYDEQIEFVKNIREWQDAALFFVRQANDMKISIYSKSWADALIKFGKYPTLSDVLLFNNFYNIDGGYRTYYVSQKNLFQYNIKEFIYCLSKSVWKTGFMKSVFKIPFPYYFIYKVMRK